MGIVERIILIIGILSQFIVYRFNKIISSAIGFAVTTFLLVWGL